MPRRRGGGTRTPERRGAILDAALHEIAERGVGGLRLRSVATVAGVHHATLLYHFPSRAHLVRAVVSQIETDFRRPRRPEPTGGGALAALRWEFADAVQRFEEDLTTTAALIELTLEARRDPELGTTLERMYAGWRYHLAGILRRGVMEGAFRADADVTAMAGTIAALVKGIGLEALGNAGPGRLALLADTGLSQVERWLAPQAGDQTPGIGAVKPPNNTAGGV
jgi:AcrR family transcriptional regulator